MPVRMNFGCGSVQPPDWCNVDRNEDVAPIDAVDRESYGPTHPFLPEPPGFYLLDILDWFPFQDGTFDYIVANHSLSDLTFHELPGALSELYRVLRPGGVLRVLVPDLRFAIAAWEQHDPTWFPQGDDLESVDERFCTFVTWFGTVGSVFTPPYLRLLLARAGFLCPEKGVGRGTTNCEDPAITSLDGDRTTSLIMEGVRP